MRVSMFIVMLEVTQYLTNVHAGGLSLSLHELAVKFLILVHNFIVTPEGTTDIMSSVVTQHFCCWLEGIKQVHLQNTTKVCS